MIIDKKASDIWKFLKDLKQQLPEIISLGRKPVIEDLIGIDFGSKFLKLLKLKQQDDATVVHYIDYVPVPSSIIKNGEITNYKLIAKLINATLSKHGINSKSVSICIPRSCAIVKNILIDSRLNKDEIESRVWMEVNHLFPNLVGEIYLDYNVVGTARDGKQLELLLVACRKDQLNPYLEVLRAAKLKPKIVDINSFALERALSLIAQQAPEVKTITLLNVSFSWIDLVVVSEGNLVYSHELNYDGSSLLDAMRIVPASEASDEIKKHNHAVLKNVLGLHLRHSMQFFYSGRPNTRIERIYLVGDLAVSIPNLKEYIHEEVGKEVVLGNPFVNMQIGSNVDKAYLEKVAPAFMLCSGLALSKQN